MILGIIIAVIVIVVVVGVAISYFDSLPPNVKFILYPTEPITVIEGNFASMDVDIKNFENYTMSNILIKTEFDGTAKYATIQDPEIKIGELNINQNTGVKTIQILTLETEGVTALISLLVYFSGIGLGVLLLFIGGMKLVYEKIKSQKNIVEQKRVSLSWQIVGSMFPGFDLLVLYRIKKLRIGSMVYSLLYVLPLVIYFTGLYSMSGIDCLLIGFGYVVLVLIWSRQWNEQFCRLNDTRIPVKMWIGNNFIENNRNIDGKSIRE